MAKKKQTKRAAAPTAPKFNLEDSRYYFLVVIAVMAIGIIILFSDFLFSNQMLYGSDTINAGIFFREYLVDYFKEHGQVPAWNPFIFAGMPYVDAFHGDIFYPLSVLKFFGNIFRTLGLSLVLHIFLAGIFMYLAGRQFKLSKIAATLAGFAYMYSGYLVSLVAPGHDGKIFVTTLFPLTLLFLDRAFEKKPVLNFTLLGLVIGIIILSPHPQLSYYTLWALAFYGAYRLILLFLDTKSAGKVIRQGGLLIYAVVIGLFISAVQFYPGYVYTQEYSPRADTKRGYDWATSWSMNEEEAVSLIVPEFAGSQSTEGNVYWGKNAFKDNSEYAGVIPLFLAIVAVFFRRSKKSIFFGALALFTFIYALGGTTPIFRLFYYIIPMVKSLRAPSTIMFVFLFCVSLLGGMAIDYFRFHYKKASAISQKRARYYLMIVPGIILLFAILFSIDGESMLSLYTSIFYSSADTIQVGQGYTKWNLGLMNLPNVQSGLWILFVLLSLTSLSIFAYLNKKMSAVILLVIPLLVMIDGIRFNSRFIRSYDYSQQFTPNVVTQFLNGIKEKFRVLNLNVVSEDYLPYFGIEVVSGYHGNQLRWYDEFLGSMGQRNKTNPHFLNLVNTKYLLAPTEAQMPENYFGEKPLQVARNFGNVSVFRNDNALDRAFIVYDYQVYPDRKDIYPYILEGAVDPSEIVLLEEEPQLEIAPIDTLPEDTADFTPGGAEVVYYADDSIVVDVETERNGILVLTDNYYYKWQAFAGGKEKDILRAYGSFRAVPIEAGTDEVIFRYNRDANSTSRLITLLTLIFVGVILVLHLGLYVKNKRQTAEE